MRRARIRIESIPRDRSRRNAPVTTSFHVSPSVCTSSVIHPTPLKLSYSEHFSASLRDRRQSSPRAREPFRRRPRRDMVKAYLRYEQAASWGVVATGAGDTAGAVCYLPGAAAADSTHAKPRERIATVALERVNLWDTKRGARERQLIPPTSVDDHGVAKPQPRVTRIARSGDGTTLACGASDGSVRIWSLEDLDVDVTFRGHKRDVTALRFSRDGSLLVSGGRDGEVVIWDVAGETGIVRLRGHRDQITDCAFLEDERYIQSAMTIGRQVVTTSKDGFVKVWDLEKRACVQTCTGFDGETWSLDVNPSQTRCAVVTGDDKIHVFDCDHTREGFEDESPLVRMGTVTRSVKGRAMTARYHASGNYLGVQGIGRGMEIYRVRDDKEAAKKQKRRLKRKREKMELKAREAEEQGDLEAAKEAREEQEDEGVRSAGDELELASTVTTKAKMRGFAFAHEEPKRTDVICKVAILLEDNSVQEWEVIEEAEPEKLHTIDSAGHRSDVRAVALSPDDETVLSCSNNGCKLWNIADGSCLRTVKGGYGLCAAFAPGGRHAIIGTKQGAIELIDVNSGNQLEVPEAHEGAVWGFALLPDESGFVSASADKTIRFWEWTLQKDEGGLRTLSFNHTKTLQMAEDVLSCSISPDGKLLSVSLLDNTLKVFFVDSLKFNLSLYGHRLPALCHDISSDSQLLASAGADKNIRIWGLDFGDCHRSIFAHQDSVMALKFVPKTHYLFSVGKDKMVKYWDADKFDPLLTLEAHHAPVWCLAVSKRGDFVITGSGDRSLRMWERTDEPFFVDEEQERRLENLFDEGAEGDDRVRPSSELPAEGEAGMAGRKTLETLSAADAIVEALELAEHETKRFAEHEEDNEKSGGKLAPIQPNPLLLGQSPAEYALNAVAKIRPSELEQAIFVLPSSFAVSLLNHLTLWLNAGQKVELTCKIASLVMRLHAHVLGRSPESRRTLVNLRPLLRERAREARDITGFNLAGMKILENYIRDNATVREDVDGADDDDDDDDNPFV